MMQDNLVLTHVRHAMGMPAAPIIDKAGEDDTNDRRHGRLEGD
jgi:hypothetical protein